MRLTSSQVMMRFLPLQGEDWAGNAVVRSVVSQALMGQQETQGCEDGREVTSASGGDRPAAETWLGKGLGGHLFLIGADRSALESWLGYLLLGLHRPLSLTSQQRTRAWPAPCGNPFP